MQRIIKYCTLFLLLFFAASSIKPQKAAAQEVSFQIFYDQLSPYGQWVNFPEEGYVWVPNAEAGFSPYQSHGYWTYTDYGWTWVSDYKWGWAPFHYGRWDFDDDYGWYWAPDYEWAPAWVAWSRSPGYYGWAPLRPGVDVDYAITSGYYVPHEHWCYVHEEYLGRRDINRYYAPRRENDEHIRNSTMINRTIIDSRRTVYMGGPSREDVEKSTKAPLKQVPVTPRSTPGQSVGANQVSIYKPVVAKTTASNPAPAPPKVASIRDLKPLAGRTPNPERLNTAPPAAATPPPTRQSPPVNTQEAPQNNRGQQRQQPPQNTNAAPPQTTTPRENPRQQAPRETTPPNAQRTTPPQNAPTATPSQQAAPPAQRAPRYAPPKYNSPKPYNPPPQQPQHQAPPQQHAEPPRAQPPQQQPQRQAPPPQQPRGNPQKEEKQPH